MCRSIIKIAQVAALVAGGLGAMNAMAADGQIRITGEVINKTCEVAINGAPSSVLLNLDPVAVEDLKKVSLKSASGSALDGSRNMRTIDVTLENCVLPSGKSTVAVSFDSTGYANPATSTYANSLLQSVNSMDLAAQGVQIGFTKINGTDLLMDLNGLVSEDYKDPTTGAQTYSFETHYVKTATDDSNVKAGGLETVATFSLVYM